MKADWFDALIVIEDDVPIHKIPRETSSVFYNQVKTMKIGQSFLFPYTRQPICANLARATGYKFTQRKVSNDQMRIWRIE